MAATPRAVRGATCTAQIAFPRFGNVFYLGETKTVSIAVQAAAAPLSGTAQVTVTDPYGKAAVETRTLNLSAGQTFQDVVVVASPAAGAFDVQLQALDPQTSVLCQAAATCVVLPGPGSSAPDDSSAMGYFFYPAPGDAALAGQIAAEMRDLGIKWVKLPYTWSLYDRNGPTRPDTSQPAWLDTAETEALVDAFAAAGIRVTLQVSNSAQWASTQPTATQFVAVDKYSVGPLWALVEPQLADWALLNRTLAERLVGNVSAWEIWNEPDSPLFFDPQSYPGSRVAAGAEFKDMIASASGAIKSVDPLATIVVNYAGSYGGTDFSTSFLPGETAVDVYGRHYPNAVGDVAEVEGTLQQYGIVGKPFWDTESRGTDSALFSGWLGQRARGAARVFPFIYHVSFDDLANPVWAAFGTAPVGPDYSARPKAAAIRTLGDMLGSAQFVRTLGRTSLFGSYVEYLFSQGSASVVAIVRNDLSVFWDATRTNLAEFKVLGSTNLTATLTVTDLMGNSTQVVPSRRRIYLPMQGNPTFLRGLDITAARIPIRFRAVVDPVTLRPVRRTRPTPSP